MTLSANRSIVVGAGGGALDLAGNTINYAGGISGAGTLTQTGAGTLVYTGADSAPLTISSGTLSLGTGASLTAALTDNSTVLIPQTLTLSNNIGGTGSVVQAAGTLTLSGTNTYSGGTFVNSGTLVASKAVNLGTGPVTLGSATARATFQFAGAFNPSNAMALNGGGGLVLDSYYSGGNNEYNVALSGNISGPGGLLVAGGSCIDFSGTATPGPAARSSTPTPRAKRTGKATWSSPPAANWAPARSRSCRRPTCTSATPTPWLPGRRSSCSRTAPSPPTSPCRRTSTPLP